MACCSVFLLLQDLVLDSVPLLKLFVRYRPWKLESVRNDGCKDLLQHVDVVQGPCAAAAASPASLSHISADTAR
jgi:hypothetical protein